MIPIVLHADDIPVILSAGILQCSEDRLSEVAQKERLAVFRDKDQMCHEQVLVVPAGLVTVHISPLEQLYCIANSAIMSLVILYCGKEIRLWQSVQKR